MPQIAHAMLQAFSAPHLPSALSAHLEHVDVHTVRDAFEHIAHEAHSAKQDGIPLHLAVRDQEQFPELAEFHRTLRDALFVELPSQMHDWIQDQRSAQAQDESTALSMGHSLEQMLVERAIEGQAPDCTQPQALQSALAELLLFESVRLRLLIATLNSPDYESFGGDLPEIDEVASYEVQRLLAHPDIQDPELRPTLVMLACASLSLHQKHSERANALRLAGHELRETLQMRANLKAALRELRLPESVLLENALASLLGQDRIELPELQARHPLALAGLSRQAMDQRVSRSRRALSGDQASWPKRKAPSLFDLLRSATKPFAGPALTPQLA